MSTFNVGLKINRTFTATTTVAAGCIAVVEYASTSNPGGLSGEPQPPIKRLYVAGQTVPSSFNVPSYSGAATTNIPYGISSGVEFANTI